MSPTRIVLIALTLLALSLAGPSARAEDMVKGNDPKAKPIKEALLAFTQALAAGDAAKAEARFAGTGADLDLLHAYLKAIAAEKALGAAMDKKFGADPKRASGPVTWGATTWGAAFDYNSVILGDKTASCSSTGPLGVGIELAKAGTEWKVRSLASDPETPQGQLKRLAAYTPRVAAITTGVEKGTIKSAADAEKAMDAAQEQLKAKAGGEPGK